jgi:small subunit ribosomal protein S5
MGTSNPQNMVKATFTGLGQCVTPRAVAAKRGKKVSEIFGRPDAAAEAEE